MVLERGEPGDRLSSDPEGRKPVRDALLSVGEDVKNPPAQQGQRPALRLLQRFKVLVDLLSRHSFILLECDPGEHGARSPTAAGASGLLPAVGGTGTRAWRVG